MHHPRTLFNRNHLIIAFRDVRHSVSIVVSATLRFSVALGRPPHLASRFYQTSSMALLANRFSVWVLKNIWSTMPVFTTIGAVIVTLETISGHHFFIFFSLLKKRSRKDWLVSLSAYQPSAQSALCDLLSCWTNMIFKLFSNRRKT